MKKIAQGFNTAAQDSNPGSRSRESEALPLSHCARFTMIKRLYLPRCVFSVAGPIMWHALSIAKIVDDFKGVLKNKFLGGMFRQHFNVIHIHYY